MYFNQAIFAVGQTETVTAEDEMGVTRKETTAGMIFRDTVENCCCNIFLKGRAQGQGHLCFFVWSRTAEVPPVNTSLFLWPGLRQQQLLQAQSVKTGLCPSPAENQGGSRAGSCEFKNKIYHTHVTLWERNSTGHSLPSLQSPLAGR